MRFILTHGCSLFFLSFLTLSDSDSSFLFLFAFLCLIFAPSLAQISLLVDSSFSFLFWLVSTFWRLGDDLFILFMICLLLVLFFPRFLSRHYLIDLFSFGGCMKDFSSIGDPLRSVNLPLPALCLPVRSLVVLRHPQLPVYLMVSPSFSG